MNAKNLVSQYYSAFNQADVAAMLSVLSDDVIHDANQGQTKSGKETFKKFLEHMNECYRETIKDLVIMTSEDGKHASAEFMVHGKYVKTDGSLPPASGQEYQIKAGAFFDIEAGKISRVTTYYNLPLWIELVK